MTGHPSQTDRRDLGWQQVVLWLVAGTLTACFLQAVQAVAVGGWSGLLEVGEVSSLRPLMEQHLPGLPLVPGGGHDGQVSYAIATDLAGRRVPDLIDGDAYRYRRILQPVLASAGGLLTGTPLLWGMIATSALGMGLATAAVAVVVRSWGGSPWAVIGVLANPGMWLAVQILTPDALGAGLALAGLAVWLRERRLLAVILFAASGLAKEPYLLVPLALAAYELLRVREPRRASLLASSLLPTLAFALFLNGTMGDGLTARGNLSVPVLGILDGMSYWGEAPAREVGLGAVTLLGLALAVAVAVVWRSHVLGWLIAPWVGLALISSRWVWRFGNNAARVYLLLWVLVALGLSLRMKEDALSSLLPKGAPSRR